MQQMIFTADLIAQHVSGTIMPIIRSSRVLYKWMLPVVFGALVFKLSVWCGAEGYVSGLRAAAVLIKYNTGTSGTTTFIVYIYGLHVSTYTQVIFRPSCTCEYIKSYARWDPIVLTGL